jgi:NADH-quinone oxidoreductase subunit C/D
VDNKDKKNGLPFAKRFEANYHLLNLENHLRIRVKVFLDEQEELPSVISLWKGADWFERELWDMFGVSFEGGPKKRLLTHQEFKGHPLRKDFGLEERQKLSTPDHLAPVDNKRLKGPPRESHWLNIGPSHPITKGALRVMVELEGEKIKDVLLEIGYLHRGFEKLCENLKYNQIIPHTDRLNYCSAALNNIGWCKAIEELMDLEIPERAKALRMVFGELSRVVDHFISIGSMAEDLGAPTGLWFFLEQRERVYNLFEKYCGARVTVSLTRIGGMGKDLPLGWANECLNVVKSLEKSLEDVFKMFSQLPWWMDKTRVCAISAKDALEWGFTGPCLRACGINYDLRKASPYYFYGDVDFDIPLGSKGDVYDRFLVRSEEIRQSLRIVTQVLDYLPLGPYKIEDSSISLPDKRSVYKKGEAYDQHSFLIERGFKPPVGEIYSAIEGANGELGFYIQSDGEERPYRVKVRPPCFPIFQAFPEVVKGSYLSDAYATLASMNVIPGELDR